MSNDKFALDKQLSEEALEYHSLPFPGKLSVVPSKPVITQHDLSLAYSPGVAVPCIKINQNEYDAYKYTNKGNLVAVISNGTAVLGLGNIGAAASKPVMEGKSVLFQRFSKVNAIDIEINETDVDKFVDIVSSLEPSFGGINLEDIKAPDCFYIEKKLKERMNIPVFHDDQHGTAIVVAAGIINGLHLVGKKLQDIKITVSGCGAAAIACVDLLIVLGVDKKNIYIADRKGIINHHRSDLTDLKKQYINNTDINDLATAMDGADVFLGLSVPQSVPSSAFIKMANNPIVFALANPVPEIMPDVLNSIRNDAIIATGRSDYPNQVNNVLCFPYIFRGVLDVGASCINEAVKLAAVNALVEVTRLPLEDSSFYGRSDMQFGHDYIIPKTFDPRLLSFVSVAVAEAAIKSKVAREEIDIEHYRQHLNTFIYKTYMFMRPIFNLAHRNIKHVILCEGEDERVLRATYEVTSMNLAKITLIGRPQVINNRISKLGFKLQEGVDYEVINNESDKRFKEFWTAYYQKMKFKGVSIEEAKRTLIRDTTLIGAIAVDLGIADALICGAFGQFSQHLHTLQNIIGVEGNVLSSMSALVLPHGGNLFITDPWVNENPTEEELYDIVQQSLSVVRRFGIVPKVALLSNSNFGSHQSASALKMQNVAFALKKAFPNLEVEGEITGDAALSSLILEKIVNDSKLKGSANLLVMPNIEAAHISCSLLRFSTTDSVSVGPILMGLNKPAHILDPLCSVRRIVNMIALACAESII